MATFEEHKGATHCHICSDSKETCVDITYPKEAKDGKNGKHDQSITICRGCALVILYL